MSEISKKGGKAVLYPLSPWGCTVVDAPKAAIYFIGAVIAGVVSICILHDMVKIRSQYDFLYLILAVVVTGLLFRVFIVNAKGYVINIENDTLTFPGGGIVADSFLSYFNPSFWLQGLGRHQIHISEIQHVQTYCDTKERLVITSDFGAISFIFFSKGKRDQLYTAIVQINNMVNLY